ncbi:MAG: MBL fold metallo-hydrolase [Muricoprocola sp.]
MCWNVKEIKKDVWYIDESGLDAMYVIKGTERSAVIDTGTGIGDFKGLIESLIDNPYVISITHGHVDHAGGCGQFEEVYIHERDYREAMDITVNDRENYLKDMENAGAIVPGTIHIEDKLKNNRKPKFHFIKEGDLIDLGNKQLLIYDMPGHTAGSICILDETDKILFSGDSMNEIQLICAPAEDRKALLKNWYQTGKRIFKQKELFDICGGGHGLIPLEKAEETLICGKMILDGKLQATVQKIHFFHAPFYSYKDIALYNGPFEELFV